MDALTKCPSCTRSLEGTPANATNCPYCGASFVSGPPNSAENVIPDEYFTRGSAVEQAVNPDGPNSSAMVIPEGMLTRGAGVEQGSGRANSAANRIPDELFERSPSLELADQPPPRRPNVPRTATGRSVPVRSVSSADLHRVKPRGVRSRTVLIWIVLVALGGGAIAYFLLSR